MVKIRLRLDVLADDEPVVALDATADANKDGIATLIALLEGAKDAASVAVTDETVAPARDE
jgi:hypothetical protein